MSVLNKPPLLVLTGPTASGKSEVGVILAEKLNGEIISADSVQIYKMFDLGAAKPEPELFNRVPHYLIDILWPDEEMNVARYREMALQVIADIHGRGKLPILVGGTGLYIKALVEGLSGGAPVTDNAKEQVEKMAEDMGREAFYEYATSLDPHWMGKVHPNDTYRVDRSVGVFFSTGKTMTQLFVTDPPRSLYDSLIIALDPPREYLYQRIDQRVDLTLAAGWRDEVRRIVTAGYRDTIKPLRSLGYRTIVQEFHGTIEGQETGTIIKKETRAYAKRQGVWIRGIEAVVLIPVEPGVDATSIAEVIIDREELVQFIQRHRPIDHQ
jgi:tRNA dimethylallyltransferase